MAWHKVLVLGLLASAAFAGCTVTTDDPDDDNDGGGTGGKTGSGGSSTGGKSAGGDSGTGTGGKASGGSSSGGQAGDGGPATCGSVGNDCLKCVKEKCCQEYLDCGADPACSQKTTSPGELICIQDCLIDQVGDAATIDVQECASRCAEDSFVSDATSALIACIRDEDDTTDGGVALQNCSEICFGAELPN